MWHSGLVRVNRRSVFLGAGLSAVASGCTAHPQEEGRPVTPATSPTASPTRTPSPTVTPSPTPTPTPRYLTERVFPTYRLFGYSGAPNAPGQGRLGIGSLTDRMVEMRQRSAPYAGGRTVRLLMELIATTVHPNAGTDGMFRTRIAPKVIDQWLSVARQHDAWLVLNIQPGRADFIDELKAYESWLAQPDVTAALDPEWAVGPGEIPGRVFGSTTGAELNACAAYLSDLVIAHNLPEKAMIYHQLHANIVGKIGGLRAHPGVAVVNSIDGIGAPGAKADTYQTIVKTLPTWIHTGFKLFYEEDVATGKRLMTPQEVLALKPQPEYVLFE